MRKVALRVGLVLLVMASLSAASLAATKVGVIDLAVIMDESKAGKRANALLAAFIEDRRQALAPMETELQSLAELIRNGDASMSHDERKAKEAQFDTLAEAYRTAHNQFEAEIDAALRSLRQQILADIDVVLLRVGDSRGFDLIIDISTAFYFRRTIDLTYEVIREYDELWEAAQR